MASGETGTFVILSLLQYCSSKDERADPIMEAVVVIMEMED